MSKNNQSHKRKAALELSRDASKRRRHFELFEARLSGGLKKCLASLTEERGRLDALRVKYRELKVDMDAQEDKTNELQLLHTSMESELSSLIRERDADAKAGPRKAIRVDSECLQKLCESDGDDDDDDDDDDDHDRHNTEPSDGVDLDVSTRDAAKGGDMSALFDTEKFRPCVTCGISFCVPCLRSVCECGDETASLEECVCCRTKSCANCDDTISVCSLCVSNFTCLFEGCSAVVCEGDDCPRCDEAMCEKHSIECGGCDETVCTRQVKGVSQCTYECTACTKKTCYDCSQMCSRCQETFCIDCKPLTCPVCNTDVCNYCQRHEIQMMQTCDSCGESVCETCDVSECC